jgi:hypothetical protein
MQMGRCNWWRKLPLEYLLIGTTNKIVEKTKYLLIRGGLGRGKRA